MGNITRDLSEGDISLSDDVFAEGMVDAEGYSVDGVQVLTSQQPAVSGPSGGLFVDTQARAAINTILNRLRAHGIIDT